MLYIVMGVAAYLFFVVYDINSILIKNKLLRGSFFAGFILLTGATAGIVVSSRKMIQLDWSRIFVCGTIALLFFLLLIYTLFFALPFQDTYLERDSAPRLYRGGVYALCRHPGVLWFIGFYFALGQALRLPLLLIASAVFSSLNILYVLFQDCWTFRKVFPDYDEYKKETPFLLPNLTSIKCCFRTIWN